jgi:hypothetical protein
MIEKANVSKLKKLLSLNRFIIFLEIASVFAFAILFDLKMQASLVLLIISIGLSPWFIKFESIYHKEEKDFFELTDFLQQFVAAFKQHPKIYSSLNECKNLSTSTLNKDIQTWVLALEKGGFPKDHAKTFIEKYPHFIVGNLVHLMLAIEHYGSFEYAQGLEIIQDDLEDWIEDTYAFKQSQQSTKRRIELLSLLSLVIAFFSHSMLFKARSLELTGFYQISLVLFLLMILFTLLMAHKALSSAWIDQRELIWRKV